MALPARRWSAASLGISAALTLGGVGCGSGPAESPPQPGLRIVAGASQTDSVRAEPVQALVVALVPPDPGLAGHLIRFESPSEDVLVAAGAGEVFSTELATITDERGHALARLRFGTRAGEAWVRVSAPEYGFLDSARYIILPGPAAGVFPSPWDTALRVGRVFTPSVSVTDFWGNERDDQVTLVPRTANLSVAGSTVMALGIGRGRLEAVLGPIRTTFWVSVVPEGRLSAIEGNQLILFDTDGGNIRRFDLPYAGFTTHWSKDGKAVALGSEGGGTPILIVSETGDVRLATPGAGPQVSQIHPRFSPRGDWLYYAQFMDQVYQWQLRRVRPDGTGDEAVPGAPPQLLSPAPSPIGSTIAVVNHEAALGPSLFLFEPQTLDLRLVRPFGIHRAGLQTAC